ncbi:putative iron-regulated protein [Mesonia phycicola]|uniref:Putative iron-regulated protein n=1 Tax=Mesonia phycicola TaxID=579105 RepID=A0A1M6FXM3_9FLAO|nr:imelysin family protein [Mesonia phycicola]SHJ02436.1 putative iron-regulated protein [Mesonia phycicola]
MKKNLLTIALAASAIIYVGCSSDDDNSNSQETVTKSDVIENYANIVYQNYQDALSDAVELQTAIETFTANPTQENFDEAKEEWLESRESYGVSEAYRFANGPIDDENGPEGLLNAWPLDENFIDYVDNNGEVINGGIINSTEDYPSITKDLLESLNENGGEKNISVGYHAIEFLLWGQDLTDPSDFLTGQRPYTDFVDGGTALNQDRRRAYLNICAELIIDNLTYLSDLWAPGGTYRTEFLALEEDEALQNMYLGITTLVSAELPIERMSVALSNADQEDEHSCFSDNTHRDIILNLEGVINVYNGTYGDISGASLADLVEEANSEFFESTADAIDEAESKVDAIYIPFDYAISGGESSTEGQKVSDAVNALLDLGANLLAGASAIGVTVNG